MLIKRKTRIVWYLESHYSPPSLDGVECIGIDEFAVKKGHIYKTIVVDLLSGRILYVGECSIIWKRTSTNARCSREPDGCYLGMALTSMTQNTRRGWKMPWQ